MTAVNVTTTENKVVVTKVTGSSLVLNIGMRGADGADGQGVPVGGTAGQVLEKIDGTDYNTQWADANTSAQSTAITLIFS